MLKCFYGSIAPRTPATGATGATATISGFSGMIPTLSLGAGTTQLQNWSVASPYYNNIAGFNPVTGNFTVPATGTYSIKATINYSNTAAFSAQVLGNVFPAFVVRRTSPGSTDLITGNLGVLNVNIALLLNLRVILGGGQVVLAGDVALTVGDVIGLFYLANGLTITITGGNFNPPAAVWSIHSL